MSANVSSMFSVREQLWWQGTSEDHGQAVILGDHPTWPEARHEAGMDWDPTEEPLFTAPRDIPRLRDDFARIMLDAKLTPEEMLDRFMVTALTSHPRVEGWNRIGRDDDPAVTLACARDSYALILNSEFGAIFEALLGVDNVKYETGGVLMGGKQVWMLAMLDEPVTIPGDGTATYPYIALMTRHDTRGSTAARATNVRVCCGNTFSFAELQAESTGLTYSFVHRGNWEDHMNDARAAVMGVRNETESYRILAENLLGIPVSKAQRAAFVEMFYPMPPKGLASDRVLKNVQASRAKLNEILDGITVADMCGNDNAYAMLQGAGEMLDHVRKAKSWETKMNRSILAGEPAKGRALSLLGEVLDLDRAQLLGHAATSSTGLAVA